MGGAGGKELRQARLDALLTREERIKKQEKKKQKKKKKPGLVHFKNKAFTTQLHRSPA